MPEVLALINLPPPVRTAVEASYDLRTAAGAEARAAVFADPAALASVRAVITNGATGLSAAQIEALPALRLIATIGVGAEAVDHAAARACGIAVTDGRGTLEDGVADHTLALLLALARDIPAFDRALRFGAERPVRQPVAVGGKRLGILGLGEIGLRVARRAEAFNLSVAYHNRTRRTDVAWFFHERLMDLAQASDFLVIAAPGGKATRHLVGAEVLRALGPQGRLINIGRGSIVDTRALVEALQAGTIAGAALDVFEGEPDAPDWLTQAPNLILTPHQAANSPERVVAMARRLLESLNAQLGHVSQLDGASA